MKNQPSREELLNEGMDTTVKLFNTFVKQHKLRSFMSREDLEDMKQECLIEMIKVVDEKFDPSRGYRLATYLGPRINGFMKDYIGLLVKHREPDNEVAVELFTARISHVVRMPKPQVQAEIDKLNLGDDQVKDLMLDLAHFKDGFEIVEALTSLPDSSLTVILGYYVLNQSIQELSEQHGFDPGAGWLSKIKREGIETLKQILREKGVL